MRAQPKAARAAIGLLILAAHLGAVLLLGTAHRARDRATVADNAVPVYITLSPRDSAPDSAPDSAQDSRRQDVGRERAEARPSTRLRAGASRMRHHRAPLLASRSAPPSRAREPARHPPAPIDWDAQAAQAAQREVAAEDAAQRRTAALTRRDAVSAAISASLLPPPPASPPFPWAPPRVQVQGLGVVVRLNDHCIVIISVMLVIGGCTIGKIEPRGDLFAHVHDPRDPMDSALP